MCGCGMYVCGGRWYKLYVYVREEVCVRIGGVMDELKNVMSMKNEMEA